MKCSECYESSIKAEETQIKRQERSGSVLVVLFIKYRVAAEARRSQRERIERNGSAKSVSEAWLGRGQTFTTLPLRLCYAARAAATILLRS